MGDLSKHFNQAEFACRCGCGFGLGPTDVNPELVTKLEQIRAHFGQPVTINSGCRCSKHNKAVGGAAHSQHLLGNAADIMIRDVAPKVVFDYVTATYKTGGAGSYRLFTHVDVRETRSVWHG